MEIESRDFRAMIFYDYKRGLTGEESHQLLFCTFGDVDPSRSTVFSCIGVELSPKNRSVEGAHHYNLILPSIKHFLKSHLPSIKHFPKKHIIV